MTRSWTALLGAVALAAIMSTTLTTAALAVDDGDIADKVQSAKTPADHEAIAAYYDGKAAAATKDAAYHRQMGQSYKSLAGGAGGKGYATSAMPQHCDAIAKAADTEAEQYKAMAKAHRDLAKSAK
jgi:hypothetical protein